MPLDHCVIGGGIIGISIAREIRERDLGSVVLLEKEKEIGLHASSRNSGVIHSGINQSPSSSKAKMCLSGSKLLREYCKKNDVPLNQCGTIVVAKDDEDERGLYRLKEMGDSLGVESLRMIDEKELLEREPKVLAKKALISPTGAVVDSLALVKSLANDALKKGVDFALNSKVKEIKGNEVVTDNLTFNSKRIINCAGLYADKIAHMMGVGKEYKVIPFRGEYMQVESQINSMVYQVPDLRYPFLGVHFTRTIEGKVLAGPNAALSLGRESYDKQFNLEESLEMFKDTSFWKMVLNKEFMHLAYSNIKTSMFEKYFLREVNSLLNESVSDKDITPYRSGIRAQLVDNKGKMVNDFLVINNENSTHVLNAVSPGMTSSLAFAKYVVDSFTIKQI